jgi:hypothetical protein
MIWRESGPKEAGPFQASDLKICDLCGALNLASNDECFVCRWRGRFERRPEMVKLAMELLERRHGRLELSLLTSAHVYHDPVDHSLRARLGCFFLRVRHWFFG